MSKYCSVCFGEYKHTIKICPKDNTPLTDQKPKAYERLIDVYIASNEIECEHIIAFLRSEGIFARESIAQISQVPVASDTRFCVAVLKEEVKDATSLIEQARIDGIISHNGMFI